MITTNKKGSLSGTSFAFLLSGNRTTLLLDAGSLTSELAQVVKLGATYLTDLVDRWGRYAPHLQCQTSYEQ